ncbi:hypothetical protein [Streptomyces sp. NPDC088196]|uniref:hypothetical protein n=1 Tax=Streptomyces sp. NPDC088196 TaxID=3154868 RepID=UPI00344C8D9D
MADRAANPGIAKRASVSNEQAQTPSWGAAPFPATRLELAARVADEPNLGRRTMTTITGHGISVGADLLTEVARRLMSGALDGTR